MRFMLICLVAMLTGCAGFSKVAEKTFNAMPSAKNCDEVTYVRKHRDITIEAKCTAPVDSTAIDSIPGL